MAKSSFGNLVEVLRLAEAQKGLTRRF